MCPVCAIGVAAGVGLSRWLGVDDAVSGIWVGALLLILAVLSVRGIFKNREKKPLWANILSVIIWWLLAFLPLHFTGFLANCGKLWGMPRLVFGSVVGLVVVLLATGVDHLMRRGNAGRARFPYQKVILPILLLIVASFIMWSVC